MQRLVIKPVEGRMAFDEVGEKLTGTREVPLNEFWARRIRDGDVIKTEIAENPAPPLNNEPPAEPLADTAPTPPTTKGKRTNA